MKMCYVSFITNDKYIGGLEVLALSLFKTKSVYGLFAVIPCECDDWFEEKVQKVKHISGIIKVPQIKYDFRYLIKDEHTHLKDTFFKLSVASLTQFHKVIVLDADLLILKNIDTLFNFPHMSAAMCGRIGHPEWDGVLLNSGLLVIEPKLELYYKLIELSKELIIRNEKKNDPIGDQDVFCLAYPDWNNRNELHIPEEYNEYYLYAGKLAKTLKNGWKDIKVLHFWGKDKPWNEGSGSLVVKAIRCIKNRRFDLAKSLLLYRKYLVLSKRENRR